ncbi:PREDICTED: homeodomain-only protein [Nanorana parkeri]|uniref:homeodomain-only protein n=1 Tax=Nanorana parkeri TaxID=125878 RepID=UPI000853FE4E|nr:PREDICTED: homeodomain-only protein [Nanorana parkeri]XP_018418868.1 PREDICTED: homeodomain-only protein [Nanorana parkeri]
MSSVPKESWENDAEKPSQEQIDILENNFNKVSKQPDKCLMMLIAAEAGLTDKATEKWFKDRLAKWRRSEGLPSECGSVMD